MISDTMSVIPHTLSVPFALIAVTPIAAQTHTVLPNAHATVEGKAWCGLFAFQPSMRIQWADDSLPRLPMSITGFGMRRDKTQPGTAVGRIRSTGNQAELGGEARWIRSV